MGMPLDASWKSINGRLDLGQLVQAYQLHHAEENKQIKLFSDKKCHCSLCQWTCMYQSSVLRNTKVR